MIFKQRCGYSRFYFRNTGYAKELDMTTQGKKGEQDKASSNGWRDRQAEMLRENLKKRKMLQKARKQDATNK